MTRARLINFTAPERVSTARPVAALREGRRDWYRLDNQAGIAELHIFDEIGYFGVNAADLVNDLRGLGGQPINVHINSPGGDVWDGVAIYNALQNHPATVTVYVDGLAASAASFIAMAGDRLVMAKTATMMIHDAMTMAFGNAADLRADADLLDKVSDTIAGIYADQSTRPQDEMRALMRAETWFNAAEAVAAGLAHEVAVPGDKTPAAAPTGSWDLSIFAFAGRDAAPAPELPAITPEEPPAPPATTNWFDAEMFRSALREAVA